MSRSGSAGQVSKGLGKSKCRPVEGPLRQTITVPSDRLPTSCPDCGARWMYRNSDEDIQCNCGCIVYITKVVTGPPERWGRHSRIAEIERSERGVNHGSS